MRSRLLPAAGMLLLALLVLPPAASAGTCDSDLSCQFLTCRSPASGAPQTLWGELEPVDAGVLPGDRDNTSLSDLSPPSETRPRWMSVDAENGWAFVGISHGLQIWNVANPAAPVRTGVKGRTAFLSWASDPHEGNPVRDIDSPPGNSNLTAIAVVGGGGLNVFNTIDKVNPSARYADSAKSVAQVYAARINGRDYAFAATLDAGLLAYDLTTVAGFAGTCMDSTPTSSSCGVYKGRLGSRTSVRYVDGVGNAAGTQHWIAFTSGNSAAGLELWDVSNPASPQLRLSVSSGFTDFIHGGALWRSGSNYYLAIRRRISNQVTQGQIYNVNCLAAGSCSTLGTPLGTPLVLPNETDEYYITHSEAVGRHFLHFGNNNRCATGLQNEWLYDVSNPLAPYDITPPPDLVGGTLTGYWGWYYRRNPTGFNEINPRMGKFVGSIFYRTAYSIFDLHRITTSGPPTAAFSHTPTTVYRGEPVSFTDLSSGVPNQWAWTFGGGSPASSTAQNPSGVTFGTVGNKTVTLVATNVQGSSAPASQQINVLDPAAQVASVTASPNPVLVCQSVSFQAVGVTGLAPVTLAWQVHNSTGGLVASGGNVNPFVWNTASATPGTYTATATAQNGSGSDTATSPTVTVTGLPALDFTSPGDAPETLNGPPFGSGLVELRILSLGATEWRWHFGDGTTPVWTTDPINGPHPSHTYADEGVYDVTVEIRNCQQGAITSQETSVSIPNTTPLVAGFEQEGLFCTGVGCFADAGEPITFVDSSSGSPDFYDYDWDGNGTYEDAGHAAPVTSHTYLDEGTYAPKLRVRRAAVEDVFTHPALIFVGDGGAPDVDVTLPGPGEVGVEVVVSATASNCTPQPTAYTWNIGDASHGAIVGAGSGTSITVVYLTDGVRTLTATAANGGCPGTAGSANLTIVPGAAGVFGDGFESGDLTAWTTVVNE